MLMNSSGQESVYDDEYSHQICLFDIIVIKILSSPYWFLEENISQSRRENIGGRILQHTERKKPIELGAIYRNKKTVLKLHTK